MNERRHSRWHELVEDDRDRFSSARFGLWTTVLLTVLVIFVDLFLVLTKAPHFVPNTVYGVLGTMFMAFASWAAGPRIAQYIGPQIGAVAQGLASAVRSDREPNARTDDERGEHTEREEVE